MQPRAKKARRILRWIKRGVLFLVAFAIFATAVVIGWLHTSWGRNYVRDKIVAELQADFPGSTITALEGSPFGTLVLRGITLNGRDKKPLVTIDRLAVSAALSPLLSKTVRVESLHVSGVGVFIHDQPPAPPKPPSPPSGPSEPTSWSIEVPDIAVTGARVELATASGTEVIDDLSLVAAAWLPAGKPLTANATVSARWRGKPANVFVVATQDGDKITVPLLTATLGDASVTGYAITATTQLFVGQVSARLPATLAKDLADIELPGDVALHVAGDESGVVHAVGASGSAHVDATVVADVFNETAHALVVADAPELAGLTDGAVVGSGSVVAAVDGMWTKGKEHARGVISAVGAVKDAPEASALLALDATMTRAELVAAARAGALEKLLGGAVAGATATVDITPAGDAITLASASVVARADDVADTRGGVDAAITAQGPLWPVRDVQVRGVADARGLRGDDLRVGDAHAEIVGRVGATDATATATVTASSVRSGTTYVSSANAELVAKVHDDDATASDPVGGATSTKLHGTVTAKAIATGVRSGTTTVGSVRANASALLDGDRGTATGTVVASGVHDGDASVARATVTFDASGNKQASSGNTRIAVDDIRSGTTHVPSATFVATGTRDIAGTIAVALGTHRVRASDGTTWSGTGGTIKVSDDAIVVDSVHTGSGRSSIVASARIDRKTDGIRAKLVARDVSLAAADSTLGGTVDADVDVVRRGGTWNGTGSVTARGVAMPGRPVVDATASVKIAGKSITLDASAEGAGIGKGEVSVAVTGPRDITDVAAWQRLPRSAIDHVTLKLPALDLAPLGTQGSIEGELAVTGSDAHGSVHVRGVATSGGVVEGELKLSAPDASSIRSDLRAEVAGIPPVTATATLTLPARPFDPRAWKAAGPGSLREARLDAKGFEIGPELLARFGYQVPYRARLDAELVADAAARSAKLTVDVRDLSGGKLKAPVAVHVEGQLFPAKAELDVKATAHNVTASLKAGTPVGFDSIGKLPAAIPIDATLTLPSVAARDLLGIVGRTDVLAGAVGGRITVGGTTVKPTLDALVTLEKLAVASTLSGKKPPVLDKLEISAKWTGERAELDITGHEAADPKLGERLLVISARGTRDIKAMTGSIQAANFDLAPLAAFAPGQLRGGRGTLHAALTIRGLDPKTGDVRGMLQIKDGRMPLSPELGNLRRATLDVQVIKQQVVAKFDGRLGTGGGSVNGKITADLEGGMPMRADLIAKVIKVQPIGAVQPQIDADVTGYWVNEGERWSGKITIDNGKIFVPPDAGTELLATGAPGDMIFVDSAQPPKKQRHLAEKPWLFTRIVINPTDVDVDQGDARVRLVAKGRLDVAVGQGMTVNGVIRTERGNADILGRRYRIEQGIVDFDGTLDPRLDIRLVHDFKNLTLTADIRGRASDPDPRLSGDPGTYTDGQLMSFFMGAEPGNSDSAAQTNDAIVSGGLTILSGRLGKRISKGIERFLPSVKLDTLNYEAATASSSRAVRGGFQLSEKSHLDWRVRPDPRADENPGELVFEYQVRSNAVFETTVGERAAGADFLLRTRW